MNPLKDHLEILIEHRGLAKVLNTLGELCMDKAEHLAVQLQDAHTAKHWALLAVLLKQAANDGEGL